MQGREEKKVQNEILLELGKNKNFRVWRHTVGTGYGMYVVRNAMSLIRQRKFKAALDLLVKSQPIKFGIKGQSDVFGIYRLNGKLLCIEVKAPGHLKDESDEQKNWGAMIRRFNGFYICVDSWQMLRSNLILEGYEL